MGLGFGGSPGEVEGGCDLDCGVLNRPVIQALAAGELRLQNRGLLERPRLIVGNQAVMGYQVADPILRRQRIRVDLAQRSCHFRAGDAGFEPFQRTSLGRYWFVSCSEHMFDSTN